MEDELFGQKFPRRIIPRNFISQFREWLYDNYRCCDLAPLYKEFIKCCVISASFRIGEGTIHVKYNCEIVRKMVKICGVRKAARKFTHWMRGEIKEILYTYADVETAKFVSDKWPAENFNWFVIFRDCEVEIIKIVARNLSKYEIRDLIDLYWDSHDVYPPWNEKLRKIAEAYQL